jgi:hypothetical protein
MIDLDRISIESANWAAERVRQVHPLPARSLSEMPSKDSDKWLGELHEHIEGYLGVIGALRRPGARVKPRCRAPTGTANP